MSFLKNDLGHFTFTLKERLTFWAVFIAVVGLAVWGLVWLVRWVS